MNFVNFILQMSQSTHLDVGCAMAVVSICASMATVGVTAVGVMLVSS